MKMLVFLLGFLNSLAFAQEYNLQPQDRLFIKGLDIRVSLVGTTSKTLKVSGSKDSALQGFTIQRVANKIVISAYEPSSKMDWKNALNEKKGKSFLEIQSPSIPVEISARDVQLAATKWTDTVQLNSVKGQVTASQGKDLRLSILQGDVTLNEHQGNLEVRISKGQLSINNSQIEGDLNIQSGNLILNQVKGRWNTQTYSASIKVQQSQGVMQLEAEKSSANISQFQGRLDAQMNEGSLNLSVQPETEANLKSTTGRLQVQVPQGAGSWLNVLTAEGELYLPGDLKANRLGQEKSFRGRLRGDSQKVSVTARSQEGLIFVKY